MRLSYIMAGFVLPAVVLAQEPIINSGTTTVTSTTSMVKTITLARVAAATTATTVFDPSPDPEIITTSSYARLPAGATSAPAAAASSAPGPATKDSKSAAGPSSSVDHIAVITFAFMALAVL